MQSDLPLLLWRVSPVEKLMHSRLVALNSVSYDLHLCVMTVNEFIENLFICLYF